MDTEYDALDAGIEPGGLRTRSNVRLLICYILNSLQKPIKKDYVITSMQKNGIDKVDDIAEEQPVGQVAQRPAQQQPRAVLAQAVQAAAAQVQRRADAENEAERGEQPGFVG